MAAALYNNRALARLRLQQWLAASTDAAAAASLRPEWHKPCFRLAQAQCELGAFKQAIATCRTGERLLEKVCVACCAVRRGAALVRGRGKVEPRTRWVQCDVCIACVEHSTPRHVPRGSSDCLLSPRWFVRSRRASSAGALTNTPGLLRCWQAGDHSRAFEPLMDRITHVAALAGSLAGFDGHVLQVRSAGEDAWLCKPAPSDPLIDQPDQADDDTAMVSAHQPSTYLAEIWVWLPPAQSASSTAPLSLRRCPVPPTASSV